MGGLAGAIYVKQMLKLSWWDLILSSLKMRNAEEGLTIFQQLRFAAGGVAEEKAMYDGDEKFGLMWAGQCIGGIHDMPSASEVIGRIVAEAEKILEAAGKKYT